MGIFQTICRELPVENRAQWSTSFVSSGRARRVNSQKN